MLRTRSTVKELLKQSSPGLLASKQVTNPSTCYYSPFHLAGTRYVVSVQSSVEVVLGHEEEKSAVGSMEEDVVQGWTWL